MWGAPRLTLFYFIFASFFPLCVFALNLLSFLLQSPRNEPTHPGVILMRTVRFELLRPAEIIAEKERFPVAFQPLGPLECTARICLTEPILCTPKPLPSAPLRRLAASSCPPSTGDRNVNATPSLA